MRHLSIGRVLLALALLASIVAPLLLGGVEALEAARALPLAHFATILGVTVLGWCARGAKLWLLAWRAGIGLRPLQSFAISLATDFGFLATPAGLGGYAANLLLLRRAGSTTAAATAVVAADQIVDALFFGFALPIAALCALGSAVPELVLRGAFAGGGVLVAAIAAALVLHRPIGRWLSRVADAPQRRARVARLHGLLAHALRDTSRMLRGDPRTGVALALLTSVQWTTRYGVLWLALAAFGHDVPYSVTLLAQGVVMHVAQWTGVPSGAGGAEFGLAAALAPWISASALAPVLLIWRAATLHLALLAGGVALAWRVRDGIAPVRLDPVGERA